MLRIKKELILVVFLLSFIFINNVNALTNINSCGTLSTTGETYVLQQDVSDPDTCFIISASGITLDLNGHTATYDTSPAITVTNGGFELGTTTPSNWDLSNAPHASRSSQETIVVWSGSYYLKFGPGTVDEYVLSDVFTIPANSLVTLGAMVFNDCYQPASAYVQFVDATGNPLGSKGYPLFGGPPWCTSHRGVMYVWTQYQTGASPVSARVKLGLEGSTSVPAYFDKITVQPRNHYGVHVLASGATIKNGKIVQGAAKGQESHAVVAENGMTIDSVELKVFGGADTTNVWAYWVGDFDVYNSKLTSEGTEVISRDEGTALIFSARGVSGQINIAHNQLIGGVHLGMKIGGGPQVKIWNNTINTSSRNGNGFAIGAYSPGIEIYNNTINCTSCRGIHAGTNANIHHNYIEVVEKTLESSAGAFAIQLESACGLCIRNNQIYNNVIISKSVPGSGRAVALRMSDPGAGQVFRNNVFIARSHDPTILPAYAFDAYEGPLYDIVFENNTFQSNYGLVFFEGIQPGGNPVQFISNTFVKEGTYSGFRDIITSNYFDHFYLDTRLQNGASLNNVQITSGSFFVKWFLNVSVKDNLNQPVQGATVQIRDLSNNLVFNGLTGSDGKIKTNLTEYLRSSGGKTFHTPHSVIVTKLSASSTTSVTLNASKEHVVTLNLGTCPDGNNDGIVNVNDLALVAYWQGYTNTYAGWNNIDHLDLNTDNRIDVNDINIIISSFGVTC